MIVSLSELQMDRVGRVTALPPDGAKTLYRLGLIPGTEVCCLRLCPLGGPGVYRFRGAVYAIRRADAAGVRVEADEVKNPDGAESFRKKRRGVL